MKITVGGKTVTIGERPVGGTSVGDDADKWPSASRVRKVRETSIPPKKWTKKRQKATDSNAAFAPQRGCGVGSNTVRGYRALVGELRAIAAEQTGCIAWETGTNKDKEKRLKRVPPATTRRDPKTRMQVER